MGLLATLALAVLGISFMVFVTFFGRLPIFRHTPIAWIHRTIWVTIPGAVLALDQRLTGGKLTSSLGRFGHFIMNDRHPTVLIFFILLLLVSEILYLPAAWPHLATVHRILGPIAIVLPYVFLYLSASSDPGIVTPANHAHQMTLFPYDFVLFHPGPPCRTCGLLKPPRSKHCPVCKRCVARLDHHCIFINNCVGLNNHHWFILLLLSTAVLALYGGVLGLDLLGGRIRTIQPHWSLWPPHAMLKDGVTPMDLNKYVALWSYALQSSVGIGAVTLLALMTSPLVCVLFGYHVYLIYTATTTNESLKWTDWRAEMADGCAFKRPLPADRPRDSREPPWTRWPVEPIQILVRTEDGEPPIAHPGLAGVGDWERVWKLRDVENLYDLGFWDNLMDVIFPGHLFEDSKDIPTTEGRGRQRRRRPKRR